MPVNNDLIFRIQPTNQLLKITSLSRLIELLEPICKESRNQEVKLLRVESLYYKNLYEIHLQPRRAIAEREGSSIQNAVKRSLSNLFDSLDEFTESVAQRVNQAVDEVERLLDEKFTDKRPGIENKSSGFTQHKTAQVSLSQDQAAKRIQKAWRRSHVQRKSKLIEKDARSQDPVSAIMMMGFQITEQECVALLKKTKGDVSKAVETLIKKM